MAELSTIARPYAQGLWKALADRGDTAQAAEIEQSLFALSSAVSEPQVAELVSDPKVTDDQMYDLLAGSIGEELPPAERPSAHSHRKWSSLCFARDRRAVPCA